MEIHLRRGGSYVAEIALLLDNYGRDSLYILDVVVAGDASRLTVVPMSNRHAGVGRMEFSTWLSYQGRSLDYLLAYLLESSMGGSSKHRDTN